MPKVRSIADIGQMALNARKGMVEQLQRVDQVIRDCGMGHMLGRKNSYNGSKIKPQKRPEKTPAPDHVVGVEKKTKKRAGWPKGKKRGPRKIGKAPEAMKG